MLKHWIKRAFGGFRRDERGTALVELAISLPFALLVFGMIIEGSRMLWAYQSAAAGVRDATRYLARIVPRDICTSGGSVAGYTTQLTGIVRNSSSGTTLFPNGITVNSVIPTYSCIAGDYRKGIAPIAQVSAEITITMPFSGFFAVAGYTLNDVTTTVTDQSRIFGS
ncbi:MULTISPECIES: TadE/TadG family type IV pilus assembly protein [Falsihalocynthiibacter]|uniref:TadE/TadG family type IV pilus assembly protein n=1 Tax=Falsihalocynthiibacter TaxID=2854182 RepID=UPI003001F10B